MSDILKDIRKEFGDNAMFICGENEKLMNIEVRSSGSLLLDLALGGGYPKGRILEFSGREKAGKTTLLNLAFAEAQRNEPDKMVALIDLEHSYNATWAETLGVDLSKLFITQPDFGAEKVYNLIEYMIKSNKFSIIGLDSVASLMTQEEFDQEDWSKESRIGGTSKLNAKAMRKIIFSGALTNSDTTLIFINQLRDKIGGFSMYGTPTETPGGRALKHSYSQMLELSIGEYFNKGQGDAKKVLGQQIRIKVQKNKIAPPFKTASINIFYDHGIDKLTELIDVAKEINVLQGTVWLKGVNPLTGEVLTDNNGNEIKYHGAVKAREALVEDIENNNGYVYSLLFETVQNMMRG